MPKTIEKKEIIDIPEGICKRVETKISEDGKNIEVIMLCEVKTQEEVKAEAEEKARREQEERERKEAEAEERLEKEKEEEERTKKKDEESEAINPTIDDYMAAMKKADEALKALKEAEREFEEKMHRKASPPTDLPNYWKAYTSASGEEYHLSEKVIYCGKKAWLWSRLGFKNIRKTWKLREDWFQDVTSKDLLTRTITWDGTLEEYCQNYGLYINSSMYTCNLKHFCGTAMQNTPNGVSKWDRVEVNILE